VRCQPVTPRRAPTVVELANVDLQQYAGEYHSDALPANFQFTLEGDKLKLGGRARNPLLEPGAEIYGVRHLVPSSALAQRVNHHIEVPSNPVGFREIEMVRLWVSDDGVVAIVVTKDVP
jgi:hypothetical protein